MRMKIFLNFLQTCTGKKLTGEEGQGLVEYSLIILLIALAVIGILSLLGVDVKELYEYILNTIKAAMSP